jgi:NAD(P)H-hydrate epimerase
MSGLSRDEVRSADRRAIQDLGVPGVVLMENAGRGAADAIERFVEGLSPPPSTGPSRAASGVAGRGVAVVAGAGNNGGDGFVVARHLAIRGARVAVFLVADPAKITGEAAVNLKIIRNLGLDIREGTACNSLHAEGEGRACNLLHAGPRVASAESQNFRVQAKGAGAPYTLESLSSLLRNFDLVVDAVGGTGIRGRLQGPQAVAVEQINAAGGPVVALDIPTGLDCDTGEAEGPVIRAALTVTFVARKKGFDAPGAEQDTGKVVVADIGVPPAPNP